MYSEKKWEELCQWLLQNQHQLSENEKEYWIKHLSHAHDKMLEVWSEQLELLDEVKEKLLHKAPLSFSKNAVDDVQGISYFHLGVYEKAIEELNHELMIHPHPARIYLYKGFSHLYMNEDSKAKECFLTTVQQTTDALEKHFAFLGLGIESGRTEDMEQAITYFEKAEALQFNPDVVYNLGICYLLLDMPKQALPYFKKVVDSGEGDAEGYYWLGKCYFEIGDRTNGMETWYNAVQEFDSKDLLLTLAVEFEEKELFSCSLYCYERMNELGYEKPAIEHGLAWIYGLMDERGKSKETFTKFLTENPYEINAWISFIWLLIKWDDDMLVSVKDKVQSLGLSHPLLDKICSESTL
ncbi:MULTISPECIES: tetratricopeptide repeat protein [Bacillaceae]|uniref:Tetratricopeptide repeat protein n=1 Tax=Evansella alkalicola TaxID=745819 RepID=A0ABS6K2D4_9BACI|nr:MULTISPECIES: tetratricopeptide repeat protein [Bacillaceae]MBU9723915.1 tetratricopeptide repeat protein [Bacillus alkalicola]